MPISDVVKVTRRQLYDEVWATPMRQLCKKYGLSDVGMAKLCKKHDIPRPPRGYWAQKQVGRAPVQAPLPSAERDCEIVLRGSNGAFAAVPNEISEQISAEQEPERRIVVAESLRGAHDLVNRANQELQSAEPDNSGLRIVVRDATLAICVSKSCRRRALLIMDALIKALLQRGYDVSVGPTVVISGVSLSFEISEKLETKRELSEADGLDGDDYVFRHNRYEKKLVTTGQLTLRIHSPERCWCQGRREALSDSPKQGLENRLNKFVGMLVAVAAHANQHREQREREAEKLRVAAERQAEEARRLAEKRALIKAERDRVESLLQQARDWRRSEDLRAFVEVVKQRHLAANGAIEEESEISLWVAWALKQADRLDPLRESPPSILDEHVPEEPEHTHRRSW